MKCVKILGDGKVIIQRDMNNIKKYINKKGFNLNPFLLYKENPLLCKGVQKSFSVQYVKKPPFVNTLK